MVNCFFAPPAPLGFLPSGTHFHFICNANSYALCTTTVCTHPTDQAPKHQIVLLQVGVLVICTWTLSYCIGGVHIYSVCINVHCQPYLITLISINVHTIWKICGRVTFPFCASLECIFILMCVRVCVCLSYRTWRKRTGGDCNGFGFPT